MYNTSRMCFCDCLRSLVPVPHKAGAAVCPVHTISDNSELWRAASARTSQKTHPVPQPSSAFCIPTLPVWHPKATLTGFTVMGCHAMPGMCCWFQSFAIASRWEWSPHFCSRINEVSGKEKKKVLSKVKREERSLLHLPCRIQETQLTVFPWKHYSHQKGLKWRDRGTWEFNSSVLLDATMLWCFEDPCQTNFKLQDILRDEWLHSLSSFFFFFWLMSLIFYCNQALDFSFF